MYPQGQTPIEGFKYTAGIGYIALPTDIDRAVFIAMCYKNNRVSIRTEDGGFVNQVPIDSWDLSRIEFPDDPSKVGSPIVYVTEQIHNHPIITSVLTNNSEVGELVEGQWKLKRKYKDNFVEICGSGKEGYLGVAVDAEKLAKYYVNVFSKDGDGLFEVNVTGEVNYNSTKQQQFISNEKILLQTENQEKEDTNSSITIEEEQVGVDTEKFVINGDTNPLILGKVFRELFDNFIDTVSQITTTTAIGQMPILNSAQVAAFKLQTEKILSQHGFIED